MCKPLVYRSKLTGLWTWDCEFHSSSGWGLVWSDVIWEALFHRHIQRLKVR